jgi:hypothetical protein
MGRGVLGVVLLELLQVEQLLLVEVVTVVVLLGVLAPTPRRVAVYLLHFYGLNIDDYPTVTDHGQPQLLEGSRLLTFLRD